MDRLICGDVGYGKTEVALRAAFKAAEDGKQVMFLVPTTVLAQQHYGTFSERLRDYPFRIEMASRFRSAPRSAGSLADFTEGKVDILIGTHRLLSRDVRPKELGLLIVDEEQRFGVKQKELLRQLRLKVDVLSLSATPIPRTLQMSLAGLRDISVIETPPEGRRPVKTYVGEYDEDLVAKAIQRELARGGQAFFLHNRVETIDETAERVRALCPRRGWPWRTARWTRARSRRSCSSFLRGDADVLVCTTIVESGLDIPTANTLIVERADELGLAQLYQIRGRVGRSRERAYAYLFYPSPAALTEEAGRGSPRSPTTPSSARASRSRCATSRSAAPATCSATSSRATWRRWASSCTWACSTRPCGAGRRLGRRGAGARAHGRAGRRLRARRLRAVRGGQDRDPPARGGRPRGRPADRAARGAGRPLRPAARRRSTT